MFKAYGEVEKVAMPESKYVLFLFLHWSSTVALVYFTVPSEAKKAFTSLAYRKYKHIPLYLEWLPVQDEATKPTAAAVPEQKSTSEEESKSKKEIMADLYTSEQNTESASTNYEDLSSSTTLYIKNLNFDTKEEKIKQVFGQVFVLYMTVTALDWWHDLRCDCSSSESQRWGTSFYGFWLCYL